MITVKKYLIVIILSIIVGVSFDFALKKVTHKNTVQHLSPIIYQNSKPTVAITASPTPTIILPSPTPKPVTIEELNLKYGPCAKVNVLMYHHIQPESEAKKLNQGGLTVAPEFFKKHLEYLKAQGYTTIFPGALANFFDNGISLPKKPVIITLDDAYEDNYLYAFPIIKELGLKATIFTPTGLVTVPDYLTWNEIKEMASSGLVYFGNHTWSHQNSQTSLQKLDMEIGTADKQLAENNLNSAKVFAYPYGKPSTGAEETLTKYGYKLAFTTVHGSIACKQKRFDIPRIRVGNAPLSSYGL